ncbi:MAG: TlpA family protein disulfide reductase [Acidimicrobiia bacterium]
MTRNRVAIAAVGAVIVTVALAAVFAGRFGEDPRAVASPLVGKPAPNRALPLLDGAGEISLGQFAGEVVVVNFWASWCVPCRREHAELTAAAEHYEGRDVRFIGIVYQDRPGDARRFLDELGRPYDNVVDPASRAAIDFGLFGVPETFFIDREGIVRSRINGPVTAASVKAAVDPLLG